MFSESDAYERFMGRWSRRLAPRLIDVAEVGVGQAVLDVGAGTGALALNFVPDPNRAVDEMIRVTRSGGVVAAAIWDYGDSMEMLRAFWDEAVALDPDAPDERRTPLSRPGELAALWHAHRLESVEDTRLGIEMPFTSFDDYWRGFLGGQGPAGAYTVRLTESKRAALRSRLLDRLAPSRGGFTLRACAWAARGVVS